MSFWGSLFGGSNPTLNSSINKTSAAGDFATGQGEGDITPASTFWKSILSGDQSQIAKALSPEISAQQGQLSQAKKQLAEFGTRSGGTTGAAASMDSTARGNITNLIGNLTNSAATNLASTGTSLLNTGISATGQAAELSQEQMQNWQNSVLGGAISGGAGIGLKWLTGKLGLKAG